MAKGKENADAQGAGSEEQTTSKAVATVSEMAVVSPELLEQLDEFEESAVTLNADSKEFEIGEVMRCFFAGMDEMTFNDPKDEEKTITKDAFRFVDKTGKVFICASTSLVNTVRSLKEGTPIQITCTGEEKVKRGKMKTFDVRALRPKKEN